MNWVVKDENDEYLVEWRLDAYLETIAKDWCLDQAFAFRFDNRNTAAHVARKLSKHGARVVMLKRSDGHR